MNTNYAALIEASFQRLLTAARDLDRRIAEAQFTRLIRERNARRSAGTIAQMEKSRGLRK